MNFISTNTEITYGVKALTDLIVIHQLKILTSGEIFPVSFLAELNYFHFFNEPIYNN